MKTDITCKNCDYLKEAPDLICPKRVASDGLPLRCVGRWSEDKFYYLERYINAFVVSMREKWNLNYIDLFCGPGVCFNRDDEREIKGSPLIALNSKHKFNNYFFVDMKNANIKSLKKRCDEYSSEKHYLTGDCNERINDIINTLNRNALSLAFIDPTGLDIAFLTIRRLAHDTRTDLIINFPFNTAIARNLDRYIGSHQSKLDCFMGEDSNWRKEYEDLPNRNDINVTRFFLGLYRKQLEELGYVETMLGEERLIRSSKKNLPLYFLVFASKSKLGHKFWKEIGNIEPDGQRKFDF